MADTAALVVALSAQLTKFEKDMSQAVVIADKKTKEIEGTFTRMNSAIDSQVSGFASSAAARLGPIGTILGSIGPVGLTVAASIGVLAGAFAFLSTKVDQFADRARALRELAETTGLSANELKALGDVGLRVGLDFEQTERFITRLALAVQDLRTKGSGPLFDVLLRINPELVRQVAAAKDVATAIDILSAAYKELNQQQQLQLTTAIAGRRSLTGGQLLGAIPGGGLGQLTDDAKAAGKAIDDQLIAKIAQLRIEIEAIKKQTDNIWGRTFSQEILSAEKQSAEFWQQIALAIERVKASSGVGGILESISRGAQKAIDAGKPPTTTTFADRFGPVTEKPLTIFDAAGAAAERERNARASELELLNRHIEALGGAATQSELLRQKTLQLAVATDKDKEIREDAVRGLSAFSIQQQIAAEAIRESLGIATEQQIAEGKSLKLKLEAAQVGLSANEVLQATNVLLKESKELADQLAIRRSYLPGLTQLALDAANVRKGLDQLAVNTFNTLGDGFADIVLKTKTLSEAFKAMTDSILRDLLRLIVRQTITGPLAGLLSSSFGGAGGFTFPKLQSGGPVSAGRPYVVGEHGPELFVPQSSGRVVPNAISTGKGSGGTSVEINNFVSADTETRQTQQQGPNGERVIIDIVKKAQARGAFDDVNRGRFALRPAKVR